jgi:hypothetical protein
MNLSEGNWPEFQRREKLAQRRRGTDEGGVVGFSGWHFLIFQLQVFDSA